MSEDAGNRENWGRRGRQQVQEKKPTSHSGFLIEYWPLDPIMPEVAGEVQECPVIELAKAFSD